MSIIGELVRNVRETSFDSLEADVIDRARDRIIDVVGCMISGADAPGCSMLLDVLREWGGRQEATVILHGVRIPVHCAALANGVMARSYDFEPAGPIVDGKSTPAHISGTTVPAAISAAECKHASGKELLTALIVGDDLASRIIAASNLNLDSGFDCTGTANAFGAAAIAGRLWGLNEKQMLSAFGIVLNQMAGTFQNVFDGTHSFKLPQGLAAQNGIFSVALAARGFTGVRDALFGKYGYFALYSKTHQPEVLTKDLGSRYYADMTCKPYPCCRSNHAAIDCVRVSYWTYDTAGRYRRRSGRCSSKAREFAVGQPFQIRDVPQIDAAFNLQYNVSNALLRKSTKLEHYTEACVRDADIAALVSRVRLTADMPAEKPLSARVKIRMKNGSEYMKQVDMPKGNGIYTPLTGAEKREKFFDNVRFAESLPVDRAEKALDMIEKLERVTDTGEIVRLLVA
jgi:2-methylcitrate dehydratase PrpD